jgi:hypothetical protein
MNIVPVNFSTAMLECLRKWLDLGKIAISPEQNNELLAEM